MTSMTEPSAAPAASRAATASCRAGSNAAPWSSSRRGKPSRSSTPSAWSRTARTPSVMTAGAAEECSSARSRLSMTGSHSRATAALVSASTRVIWAAHLFRRLSRSARGRRRRPSGSAIRPSGSAGPPGCAGPAVSSDGTEVSLIGGELGVDHVVVARGGLFAGRFRRWRRAEDLVDGLELGGDRPYPLDRGLFPERLAGVGDQAFGPWLLVYRQGATAIVHYLLDLVRGRIQLVAGIGQLAQPAVLVAVLFGVGHHPLDLALVQIGGLADRDPLLGPGVPVAARDVEDAVRVDVEGDLDLRPPARGRPDVLEPEPGQHPVVGGAFPLALQDDDIDGRLIVLGGAEHLGAPGRDRRVALDDLGHYPAHGLDAERQRGDVEQQHVLHVALDHGGLDRCAQGYDLVRVHGHVRVFATGQPPDQVLHGGDPGGPADQDHLVDV